VGGVDDGLGIFIQTGVGDGAFPVFGEYDGGTLTRVIIDFTCRANAFGVFEIGENKVKLFDHDGEPREYLAPV
jgi:hypothetical protein